MSPPNLEALATSFLDYIRLNRNTSPHTAAAYGSDLGQFLARRHVAPPYLGSYPMLFTSYNFIDLQYLGL